MLIVCSGGIGSFNSYGSGYDGDGGQLVKKRIQKEKSRWKRQHLLFEKIRKHFFFVS